MAQHKYDLVTVPTKPTGPPRHHPWYKERLDLKFTKHGRKSGCLDGRKWTLLAGNMDDFRTGVPAHSAGTSMVVKGKVDPIPLVNSSNSSHFVTTGQPQTIRLPSSSLKCNPGHSTLRSKVGPRRQAKLARLKQLENKLLQSPLSLYPHLQEGLPSEAAEDVARVLCSELRNDSVPKDESYEEGKGKTKESNDGSDEEQEEEGCGQSTIYRWPLRQTEEEKKEEQRAIAAQKVISPAQEARVDAVTHNLVQWGRELGGSEKSCDIDEATVKSLFASDHETRPLTAPIHVVDLHNVPLELQGDSPLFNPHSRHLAGSERSRRRSLTTPHTFYKTNRCHVKSRYGAWYLPTSLWRLQRADEPLSDPRNLISQSAEDLARQDEELDNKISQLHGTQEFRAYFIDHKPGWSLPSFLKCVPANTSS